MYRPHQEQEEERADVRAARGSSETEEGGLESRFQALLRPENSPPASKPPAFAPLPPHHRLPVPTIHLSRRSEEEETDIWATWRVPDAAEGGVESRVSEVLRPKNWAAPDGSRTVRPPAPEHGAVWRNTGTQQRRVPHQQWGNNVQLRARSAAGACLTLVYLVFCVNVCVLFLLSQASWTLYGPTVRTETHLFVEICVS